MCMLSKKFGGGSMRRQSERLTIEDESVGCRCCCWRFLVVVGGGCFVMERVGKF